MVITLFKNRTSWIPLGSFVSDNQEFVVFARKNFPSGMIDFKTKRVNRRGIFNTYDVYPILPPNIIDVAKQWDLITNVRPDTSLKAIT